MIFMDVFSVFYLDSYFVIFFRFCTKVILIPYTTWIYCNIPDKTCSETGRKLEVSLKKKIVEISIGAVLSTDLVCKTQLHSWIYQTRNKSVNLLSSTQQRGSNMFCFCHFFLCWSREYFNKILVVYYGCLMKNNPCKIRKGI